MEPGELQGKKKRQMGVERMRRQQKPSNEKKYGNEGHNRKTGTAVEVEEVEQSVNVTKRKKLKVRGNRISSNVVASRSNVTNVNAATHDEANNHRIRPPKSQRCQLADEDDDLEALLSQASSAT